MKNYNESLTILLQKCLIDKKTHAKLLALFSILENIGARKIHRFQRFDVFLNEDLLSHAAEESRHALFFAKRYRRLVGQPLNIQEFANLRRYAKRYFRLLDIQVGRLVQAQGVADGPKKLLYSYLLTTKIIEEQAAIIYRTYESIIGSLLDGFSLRAILEEEKKHLDEMNTHLGRLPIAINQYEYKLIWIELEPERQQMFNKISESRD